MGLMLLGWFQQIMAQESKCKHVKPGVLWAFAARRTETDVLHQLLLSDLVTAAQRDQSVCDPDRNHYCDSWAGQLQTSIEQKNRKLSLQDNKKPSAGYKQRCTFLSFSCWSEIRCFIQTLVEKSLFYSSAVSNLIYWVWTKSQRTKNN